MYNLYIPYKDTEGELSVILIDKSSLTLITGTLNVKARNGSFINAVIKDNPKCMLTYINLGGQIRSLPFKLNKILEDPGFVEECMKF